MEEPIVILGMPRSGSSMTSGIFAEHGCWVGNCMEPNHLNPKGFFENLDVKKKLIEQMGRLAQTGGRGKPFSGFRDYIEKLQPQGRWVVKHSAMYWPAWWEFRPKWIFVRRDVKGILESNRQTGYLGTKNTEQMETLIRRHFEEMDFVKTNYGGRDIFTHELVKGNYESLEKAFEYVGISFKPEIVKAFIDQRYWHH